MLEEPEVLEIPESAEELSEEQALQLMEQFTQELEEQEESYAHTARLKKNIFFIEYACDEASQLSKFAKRKGWEYLRLTRNTYDLRTRTARDQILAIVRQDRKDGKGFWL